MKKIFTLLFSFAMLSSAFAQYNQKDDHDNNRADGYSKDGKTGHDKDDNRFSGRYYFTPRERDVQIAQINREYDYRIQAVKNKFFMSWTQKKRQIEFLKDQRDKEIRRVYLKFNDRRNMYNDHHRRDRQNW